MRPQGWQGRAASVKQVRCRLVIRRSFRIGLWLGLLARGGAASDEAPPQRRAVPAIFDLGTPAHRPRAGDLPPLEAPVSTLPRSGAGAAVKAGAAAAARARGRRRRAAAAGRGGRRAGRAARRGRPPPRDPRRRATARRRSDALAPPPAPPPAKKAAAKAQEGRGTRRLAEEGRTEEGARAVGEPGRPDLPADAPGQGEAVEPAVPPAGHVRLRAHHARPLLQKPPTKPLSCRRPPLPRSGRSARRAARRGVRCRRNRVDALDDVVGHRRSADGEHLRAAAPDDLGKRPRAMSAMLTAGMSSMLTPASASARRRRSSPGGRCCARRACCGPAAGRRRGRRPSRCAARPAGRRACRRWRGRHRAP